MAVSDKQWKQRRLCSDGNCIGIIGEDGRCKECGLPYKGELPSSDIDDGVDDLAAEQSAIEANDPTGGDPASVSDCSDDSWENRTLCIDESCIGIIGPDGCCKACGKPHPGKQP